MPGLFPLKWGGGRRAPAASGGGTAKRAPAPSIAVHGHADRFKAHDGGSRQAQKRSIPTFKPVALLDGDLTEDADCHIGGLRPADIGCILRCRSGCVLPLPPPHRGWRAATWLGRGEQLQ